MHKGNVSLKIREFVFRYHLPIFLSTVLISLFCFDWFVSDPVRAARLDRYIVYSIDDILRYCHVKASVFQPLSIISPESRVTSILISRLFFFISARMITLRIMNSIFAVATLYLLYLMVKRLESRKYMALLSVIAALLCPLFFLGAISTLSEVLFGFILLAGIYAFYNNRYLLSAVLISLLPTIRQEGTLYAFIWFIMFMRRSRWAHAFLLLVPACVWSALVTVFLKKPPLFTFWFLSRGFNCPPPVISLATWSSAINVSLLAFAPTVGLCVWGIGKRFLDKRYSLVIICLCVQVALFTANELILGFLTKGMINDQVRYLIPIVPLAALFIAVAVSDLAERPGRKHFAGSWRFAVLIVVLAVVFRWQMGVFQDYARKTLAVSQEQEVELKNVSEWLREYMKKENIANIYMEGEQVTQKFLGRVHMRLPFGIRCYAMVNEKQLFNPSTFELIPNSVMHGVAVSMCDKCIFLDGSEAVMIKKFPEFPLYFFAVRRELR